MRIVPGPARAAPSSNPRRSAVRAALLAASLICLAPAAVAAELPRADVHGLWVGHLLAAFIAGLLGYVSARSTPLAGIVFVATLAYTAGRVFGSAVPPEVMQQFGAFYPFHVQATALLLPLAVLCGYLAARTAALGSRRSR